MSLILGIETSCDETAAAVVQGGRRVRSQVVASQVELHAPYGGVYPELASRAQLEAIAPVCRAALAEAGCSLAELDAIAVTQGPGLVGSLLVGIQFAKGLGAGQRASRCGASTTSKGISIRCGWRRRGRLFRCWR